MVILGDYKGGGMFLVAQVGAMKTNIHVQKRRLIGYVAGILAGASYGANPLFGKALIESGVPIMVMLFFRYGIAAAILWQLYCSLLAEKWCQRRGGAEVAPVIISPTGTGRRKRRGGTCKKVSVTQTLRYHSSLIPILLRYSYVPS